MSYHHKSGAQKRREKAMRAEGVKGQNTHGFAGVETRDTRFRSDTKSVGGGGGGAVHIRPDTKSGEGGGCCSLLARYNKRGGGGGGGGGGAV